MPKLVDAKAKVQTGTLKGTVLDGLLWDGKIEFNQHFAALAYAKLRRQAKSLVGFDRFALDRLAVDGMEPVGSELERLLGVLDRLARLFRCWD